MIREFADFHISTKLAFIGAQNYCYTVCQKFVRLRKAPKERHAIAQGNGTQP